SEVVQVLIEKKLSPEKAEVYRRFQQVMDWAEGHRKLKVRTNADLPDQAAEAIAFGAEGIGLCRTEHMFFDHIAEMREMIMAETTAAREAAGRDVRAVHAPALRGALRGVAGRAGAPPPLAPAAARVPAAGSGRPRGDGPRAGQERRGGHPPRGGVARVQPDARPPRLPAGHRLPGDHRDAGAGDLRGRGTGPEGGGGGPTPQGGHTVPSP